VYGLAVACEGDSTLVHINRDHTNSDASDLGHSRAVSTFTVMEIITG